MSAANVKLFFDATHPYLIVPRGVSLKPVKVVHHNQSIAMDADQFIAKLCFQFTQGIVNQYFTLIVPNGDIFVISLKKPDF